MSVGVTRAGGMRPMWPMWPMKITALILFQKSRATSGGPVWPICGPTAPEGVMADNESTFANPAPLGKAEFGGER
jgi:hypothetical protein